MGNFKVGTAGCRGCPMVAERTVSHNQGRQFLIRPNCSLGRYGTWIFFAFMLFATLVVASYFVSMGAWLVLPFAGLEMLLLGGALHLFVAAAERRELITITNGLLRVERSGGAGKDESWDFQPYWVQVVLRGNPATWHPSRLLLRSHGRELLIGECLTDEERQQLANNLGACLAACR